MNKFKKVRQAGRAEFVIAPGISATGAPASSLSTCFYFITSTGSLGSVHVMDPGVRCYIAHSPHPVQRSKAVGELVSFPVSVVPKPYTILQESRYRSTSV